eukprot:c7719_g1_i1.p1 GENE.c7719_g1_i1~~c7719_g1_i1.p1  ORF type:complete len:130 (-),score=35.93 c7719_g1_i1:150-539(-)
MQTGCVCYWGRTCASCSEACYPTESWPNCLNTCGLVYDPQGKLIDVGGASCTTNAQCYELGGRCSAGKCTCYSGWACPTCEFDANLIRNGTAKCKTITVTTSSSSPILNCYSSAILILLTFISLCVFSI